jgi:hypothetical protein
MVYLQAWVTGLLLVGMVTWSILAARNVRHAQAGLTRVGGLIAQSELELTQLRQQLELKQQLEFQKQIVARLGLPVEASRLIGTLGALMPKEMSLLELTFDTEESVRAANGGAAKQPGTKDGNSDLDRRLKVRMLAVAPSDVDLANFLAGLTNTPFFEQVSMTFARDKSQDGHLMREFEVTFGMNLNHPMAGAQSAADGAVAPGAGGE